MKNHSIAGVDVLGLRIILDSRDIPVAQIQATKGVPAYTGETNGIAAAYPKREGPDELISKIEGRKCCVKINKASNFTISVSHLRPSDIDRGAFFMDNILYMATAAGKAAVWAHEDRRLLVYQQADEVFLQPVEAESPLVTKCGWICRDSLAQAEEELRHYISKLREDSYWQYKKFVDDNQDGIEKERTIITDVRKLKVKDNQGNIKIMDVNIVGGMDNIHVWNRPTATWTAQCPNP